MIGAMGIFADILPGRPWPQRLLVLAAMTALFALLSYIGSAVYHRADGFTTVKPFCGVGLAFILIRGRSWLWPVLITGTLGGAAAKYAFAISSLDMVVPPALAAANLWATHAAMGRLIGARIDFRRWRQLVSFIGIAAVTSALTAFFFAFVFDPTQGAAGWPNWLAWWIPTTLSHVLFTPVLVLLATASPALWRRNGLKIAVSTLLLCAMLACLFVPTEVPLSSTIPLSLLLISLVCEIEGVAIGLLVTQAVITIGPLAGYHMAALSRFPLGYQLYFSQIFLGALVTVMLPAAAAISERRTLQDRITAALRREEKTSQALRASEARYRQKAEEAAAASHAKSEFLASMSHELRTPLNAILGFSEILKNEIFGPLGHVKYREYADDVHRSGEHLLDLINDVLDLSKIDAGKMELRERRFALEELVTETLALVRGRAANLTLRTELPDNLPDVIADFRLTKQILLNLLSNAIKFTPGGGVITIGAARTDDGGLQLHVTDTGIGMEEAQLDKAFSHYGQIDSKVARTQQGTGLGLPISRALARLHGGDLVAQSQPGNGTRMTLLLPPARVAQRTGARVQKTA
jgi:signal transduction histidine kinase